MHEKRVYNIPTADMIYSGPEKNRITVVNMFV